MSQPASRSARRRDRILGLTIILVAFAGCLALSLWAKERVTPKPAPEPAPPTTRVAGFPERVRPFEVLAQARELTVRTLFQGFVAKGIEPDGTIDFSKKGTRLRFSFQSPPGMGPQPPHQDDGRPPRSYCGKQSVRVTEHGMGARPDVTDAPCSSKKPTALKPPKNCSIQDVWEMAEKQGPVPKRARIEFYRARSGPAYRFVGKKNRFSLSAKDCKTLLEGRKQRGTVP